MKKMFEVLNPTVPRLEGLEMKAIKSFRGHDGPGYHQGNLYYKGKKIAFLGDSPTCGPLEYDAEPKNQALYDEVIDFIEKGKFKVAVSDHELEVGVELYFADILRVASLHKDAKKDMNKYCHVYVQKMGRIDKYKAPYKGNEVYFDKEYKDEVILSSLID